MSDTTPPAALPWISVRERLPKMKRIVIAWVGWGWYQAFMDHTHLHGHGWYVCDGGWPIEEGSVTHWLDVTPPTETEAREEYGGEG